MQIHIWCESNSEFVEKGQGNPGPAQVFHFIPLGLWAPSPFPPEPSIRVSLPLRFRRQPTYSPLRCRCVAPGTQLLPRGLKRSDTHSARPSLTERAESVVDGDDDDAVHGEHGAVVQLARPDLVRPAVDVDHDRVARLLPTRLRTHQRARVGRE